MIPLFEALVRAWGGAGFHNCCTTPWGSLSSKLSLREGLRADKEVGVKRSSRARRSCVGGGSGGGAKAPGVIADYDNEFLNNAGDSSEPHQAETEGVQELIFSSSNW